MSGLSSTIHYSFVDDFSAHLCHAFVTDVSYTLTLDADLQASRVTSRGLFTKNNERFLTEKKKISSTEMCLPFEVYVQVRYIKIIKLCAHLNILFLYERSNLLHDLPLGLFRRLQIL